MISNVTIKNYKSVVDVSLPLGRFNLLIGANGCGKSNILEGIALGAAAYADKLDYEYFANRGIRIVQPHLMLPAFEDIDAEGVHLSYDNDHVLSYNICYNKNGKPAKWMVEKREGDDEIPGLGQFLIYSLEESKLRKADDSNRTYPMGLHGEGLFAYLKEMSQRPEGEDAFNEINANLKVLDWFDDMQVPSGQLSMEFNLKLKDIYLSDTLNIFDQRSTNEGFLYLLFYFTLVISDETPKFFAIENIDTAFNPKLCREVIKRLIELAKKHDKQIIATTHNPAILDGLDLRDDEQKLMVVQRSIDGYTKVRTLKKEQVVNSDLTLSQLWLRGFIGGLPNNF